MNNNFHIIAIGLTEDGIPSLYSFLQHFNKSVPAALIIYYFETKHSSAELIKGLKAAEYAGDVMLVDNEILLEPPNVYIVPNHGTFTVEGNMLHVINSEKNVYLMPLDGFYRCLSEQFGDRVIGVVLSGKGSDGVTGLLQIREKGGLTLVEDPQKATSAQLPENALKNGVVDIVAEPSAMPDHICLFIEERRQKRYWNDPQDPEINRILQQILHYVQVKTGHSFFEYKKNTILRRLERRLHIHALTNLEDYLAIIKNTAEAEILAKDFLISVTNFFRDPQVFDYIKSNLVPELFNRPEDQAIRIWVPGCASGEEAYSLALLIKDYQQNHPSKHEIQIFASDIDREALNKARKGKYSLDIVNEVPEEILSKFFKQEADHFRIHKEIKDLVLFAEHNLIQDPPYSSIDLISCRNLLIYLDISLQQKILRMVHYALKPEGILVAGLAENMGYSQNYYDTIHQDFKVYRKSGTLSPGTFIHRKDRLSHAVRSHELRNKDTIKSDNDLEGFIKTYLLQNHTSPAVFINKDGNIHYIHGKTGKYLEMRSGPVTSNLFSHCRKGLKIALINAVNKAYKQQEPVMREQVRFETESGLAQVNISVFPVHTDDDQLLMIAFDDHEESLHKMMIDSEQITIFELEKELEEKEAYLQKIIKELEEANEKLEILHEEEQSTNEELKSSNEELVTSKEELQSVNEEVVNANKELNQKIDEINRINSTLKNLLSSTQIATLFLDRDLKIFQFTPAIQDVVDLLESDIGRPLAQLNHHLSYQQYLEDAQSVLDSTESVEKEVKATKDIYYWMRIVPYRNIRNEVDGVVMTFTDITAFKRQEEELDQHRNHLEDLVSQKSHELKHSELRHKQISAIVSDIAYSITIDEADQGTVEWTFGAFEAISGYTPQKGQENDQILRMLHPDEQEKFKERGIKLKKGETVESEFRIITNSGKIKWIHDHVEPEIDPKSKRLIRITGVIKDITERKQQEIDLLKNKTILEQAEKISNLGSWELDIRQNKFAVSEGWMRVHGVTKSSLSMEEIMQLAHQDDRKKLADFIEQNIRGVEHTSVEFRIIRANDQQERILAAYCRLATDQLGQHWKLYGSIRDVTDRKRAESELRESEQKFRGIDGNIPGLVIQYKVDKSGNEQLMYLSPNVEQIFEISHKDAMHNIALIWRRLDPADVERYQQKLKESATSLLPFIFEHRIILPGQRKKWLEVRAIPRPSDDGSVIWDALAIDITDKKSMEEALLLNQKKLEKANNIAKMGHFEWNIKSNEIYWSDEVFRLYGLQKQPITFDLLHKHIYPDDFEYWSTTIEKSIRKKSAFNIDFRILKTDGSVIWLNNETELLLDKEGHPEKLIGTAKDITERKEAEEALRASEEKYRLLAENMVDMIGLHDADGTIIYQSPSVTQVLGYKPDELIGKNSYELFHPDDQIIIKEKSHDLALQGHQIINLEYRVKHKTGEYIWLATTTKPLFNEHNEVYRLQTVSRNITQQKLAEEALKESEQKLSLITNSLESVIYMLRVEGKDRYRFEFINDYFFKDTGFSREHFESKLMSETMPLEYWERDMVHYRKAVEEQKAQKWEAESPYSRGSQIGMVCIVPILNEKKECVRILGIITDISRRIEIETELKRSQEKYKNLSELTFEGILIHTNGRLNYMNQALEKLLGYTEQELENEDIIRKLVHEEDVPVVLKNIRFHYTKPYEVRCTKKDGTELPVELEARSLEVNGETRRVVAVRDITERKKAADILKKSEAELRELNHTKDRLFSIIGHDLKNPFVQLIELSRMIKESMDEKDYQEAVIYNDMVQKLADQGHSLLINLLEWSRNQTDTTDIFSSDFDLDEVIDETCALLQPAGKRKNIVIKFNPTQYRVFADRNMVMTVLRNLVGNAVKFSFQGSSVEIKARMDGTDFVCVSVLDKGKGLKQDEIDKLFNLNQNFTTRGTDNEKGSGLGLILCKEFVDKNGGQIWVESKYGKGSCFHFTLPVARQH